MRVIAGKARRLNLKTVPGMETRPTTDRIKETLFNILQDEIPGCSFLDLFAGSGAIGIEALSRGAARAVFVDRDNKVCDCIRENLRFTRLEENARVIRGDAVGALRSLDRSAAGPFDIIFMDPPYDHDLERGVLTCLAGEAASLADDHTLIIVEASLETDLSYAEDLGFSVVRSKIYKTNQHIFLRRAD